MATATSNGFSKTSGFVEQIKRSENRTALKVGDSWFSTFGTCAVEQGDEVNLSYVIKEKDGKIYRNLKHVEPVQPAPKPNPTVPTGHVATDKDTAIARAVALKTAARWVDSNASVDAVLDTADAFLAWLQGNPVAQDDEQGDVPF